MTTTSGPPAPNYLRTLLDLIEDETRSLASRLQALTVLVRCIPKNLLANASEKR